MTRGLPIRGAAVSGRYRELVENDRNPSTSDSDGPSDEGRMNVLKTKHEAKLRSHLAGRDRRRPQTGEEARRLRADCLSARRFVRGRAAARVLDNYWHRV